MLVLATALTQAIALDNNIGLFHDNNRVLSWDATSSGDYDDMQLKEHQGEDDLTLPSSSSGSSFSSTSIILITLGCLVVLGLALLLVVIRRARNDEYYSDCEADQSPENLRPCIKRTTFVVPEVTQACLNEMESSGSVIPVMNVNANHCKLRNGSLVELKPSWADASAATMYHHSKPVMKPKVPMLIYKTTNEQVLNESRVVSDNGSHTDDYSIDILESPMSIAYSFESEGDVFSPTCMEDADSYWSLHDKSLSTSSPKVFGSVFERNSESWQQLYDPNC